jgi:hypothetical protein
MNYYRAWLMTAFICTALTACKRDEIIGVTPASYILGSEHRYIPASVELPADAKYANTRIATWYATGIQQYRAKAIAETNPTAFEWTLVAPRADLYDVKNRKVGTHGAGPVWRTLTGDSIVGQHFSPPKTAPGDDANSIDLLLLMPKTSTGIFAEVEFIQRIATKGGKAPVAAPTHANETVEVRYEAVYRFTKRNPQ